jgi:uncharacterized membrane-anchored protein YitT (DUF2179 family)
MKTGYRNKSRKIIVIVDANNKIKTTLIFVPNCDRDALVCCDMKASFSQFDL